MCVGIAVPFVVQGNVGTHADTDKVLLHIIANNLNLSFAIQLARQRNIDFTRQPRVLLLLDFLHGVP